MHGNFCRNYQKKFILTVNCPGYDTFVFTKKCLKCLDFFAIFVNCAIHVQMFTHCYQHVSIVSSFCFEMYFIMNSVKIDEIFLCGYFIPVLKTV